MNYEHLTLGNDAAWGGWGQCLADAARGPLWVGWQKLGGRTWRWTVLREALAELDQLSQLRSIRVVVEKPPAVYKGAGRHGQHGKRAGNQAVVGYGMGQLIGPILAWGEGHHVLDEAMQPHNPESPTRGKSRSPSGEGGGTSAASEEVARLTNWRRSFKWSAWAGQRNTSPSTAGRPAWAWPRNGSWSQTGNRAETWPRPS